MGLTNIFLLGFVLGESLTAVTLVLWILYLNKKRFGVYKLPKNIRNKYRKIIRDELKNV